MIDVSINRQRVKRGQVLEVSFRNIGNEKISAELLTPTAGVKPLQVTDSKTRIEVSESAPDGLYVVHAWIGDRSAPSSVGKGTFLLGRVITDFFIPAFLDSARPSDDLQNYLKEFRSIGGNFLVVHNLITPTKAYFPSKIARTDVTPGSKSDLVELTLNAADKEGIPVLLSVSWDMTKTSPYQDRMNEIKAIASELYQLYKQHPSLAGFYSYQEGSGTYYAAFVREFAQYIKSINANLLTACAPHVDDPLLAGYLSTVAELDIIIYQAGVMASYRTDNRKMYPFRRVKDFCSLGAGAKRLQDKISINHVELFGYLENRLTPTTTATTYNNIYQQILSASTVTGADGLSFFTYQAHVYGEGKKVPEVATQGRAAVRDAVKAFDLISKGVSVTHNPIAVYFPYSDWIIERWHDYFLPALDAFRVLGIPVDLLPYAPPIEESVYPYYPFNANKDVLRRLLSERTVLVMPNVSGFQQTDSDLIKAFVEQGGVVVAFGPQVPMGRSYERTELFGIEEIAKPVMHSNVRVTDAFGPRVKRGTRFLLNEKNMNSWTSRGARVIAKFEDGSPAVAVNKFGKGTLLTVLPDAMTAAHQMPDLVRDVLELAVVSSGKKSIVDLNGANENTDSAVAMTGTGFRVALINYNDVPTKFSLRPSSTAVGEWFDLFGNQRLGTDTTLSVVVPAHNFRAVEFRTMVDRGSK